MALLTRVTPKHAEKQPPPEKVRAAGTSSEGWHTRQEYWMPRKNYAPMLSSFYFFKCVLHRLGALNLLEFQNVGAGETAQWLRALASLERGATLY